MSDDSHGIAHVATNYRRLLEFIKTTGISSITFLEKGSSTTDPRFPGVFTRSVSVAELQNHPAFL